MEYCSTTPPELPPELWLEILSYIPTKPLMRFKSVSRLWLSIIFDPALARLHCRRPGSFKGLLISNAFGFGRGNLEFCYVNLDDQVKQISRHHEVGQSLQLKCTYPVNGLVCFYEPGSRGNSYLHNVATQETLQLPTTKSPAFILRLGFDPVTKLYKLLKMSIDHHGEYIKDCEILTFGEGQGSVLPSPEWRSIDSPSPPTEVEFFNTSVCYDGVIYGERWGGSDAICGFHLSKEMFFSFPKPESCEEYERSRLLHFGPGLTLSTYSYTVVKAQCKVISCHGDLSPEVSSELKFEFQLMIGDKYLTVVGILPDGKIVSCGDLDDNSEQMMILYVYDPSRKKTENFQLDSASLPRPSSSSSIFDSLRLYFQENIVSLRCLIPH
ncbi:OLC1v1006025C1 [Oldenlandia corymbosa var. corymbosa]|uniref:OLC1v1006025C1 n=1 Tax=Oldenlandia corymbosa var. corymbosa TaxID=529605 RepID=A0AAV1DHB8_OLDCO|nr:OLC1v1006025C1 [Oldenlandia corymbosa var. corymbosa]